MTSAAVWDAGVAKAAGGPPDARRPAVPRRDRRARAGTAVVPVTGP